MYRWAHYKWPVCLMDMAGFDDLWYPQCFLSCFNLCDTFGKDWDSSLMSVCWGCIVILSLAMDFHENLQNLAMKEGLKGSKVSRALESFSWNITILKVSSSYICCFNGVLKEDHLHLVTFSNMLTFPVWTSKSLSSSTDSPALVPQGQADLLIHAKAEVEDNMKQVHDAALTGNLCREGIGLKRVRSLTGRGPDDNTSAWGPSSLQDDLISATFHITSLFSSAQCCRCITASKNWGNEEFVKINF